MTQRALGLGVIGLGMAGAVMVRAAARHPGTVLTAAADPQPGPREAFGRDFNARTYADARALCEDPAVEVVYIATPHQFHAEHAVMAAERGKHVILEKPMALTLADCDKIIAAVERANVYLIVGHTHALFVTNDPTDCANVLPTDAPAWAPAISGCRICPPMLAAFAMSRNVTIAETRTAGAHQPAIRLMIRACQSLSHAMKPVISMNISPTSAADSWSLKNASCNARSV